MEYDNLPADRSSAMNVNAILNYTMANEDTIDRSIKILADVISLSLQAISNPELSDL